MNFSPFSFVRKSIDSLCQAAKQRLRRWAKPYGHALVLSTAMDLTRSKPELALENMLLRQQLIVLKRQMKQPALSWRDRTLFVLLASRLRTWKQALVIVQPETVLRWHRDLYRRVWMRKSRPRRRGKPPLTSEIVSLIKKIAKENRTWGAERFLGSVRRECLDHFLILSERHLYRLMKQYQGYFNHARPHQGIGQTIPCQQGRGTEPQMIGGLITHPVLGGLHHDYHWQSHERPSFRRAA